MTNRLKNNFKVYILKTLFFFYFFLCSIVYTFGQSNISIHHYTKNYGIDYRWVYDITQDDHGFLWFATHTGLRRYDGSDFVTYVHSKIDTNSISNNTIKRVSNDNQGNIWAYSIDKVFNKLHLASGNVSRVASFIKKGIKVSMNTSEMKSFKALNNGDFIALFQNSEQLEQDTKSSLWKFNYEKNVFEYLIEIPTQGSIDYFTERPDGKLWLWGMGTGYYLVDISNNNIAHYSINRARTKSQYNNLIPIDEQRIFWYPSNYASELKSFKIPYEIDVLQVERITLDNLGNIWFYDGEKALYHFNRKTEALQKFIDPMFQKSRGLQVMYHFFVDDDGAYWNGHFFGAVRFSKKPTLFNNYFNLNTTNYTQNLKPFSAREMIAFDSSSILVKENNHDLFIIDLKSKKTKKVERNLKTLKGENISKEFYSMFLSDDGYLWTNQADKLIKINIKTGTCESFNILISKLAKDFDKDPFKKYWPRIFEDSSKNIWWCDSEKLNIYDRVQNKMIPVNVKEAPGSVTADFKFASYDAFSDAIYASYNNGIYIVDCKSKSVSLIEIFSNQEKYNILITNILKWKNEFWLSTNKGLIRYNPKTKQRTTYSSKDGLPTNIVFSSIGTEDCLWLATRNGLCQFNPETLRIVNFFEEQGLPHNDFNIWSYLITANGNLYFGGQNGVVGFNPSDFKISNEKNGQFNLVDVSKYNRNKDTSLTIQNLPYKIENNIRINPNERTLTLTYKLARYDDLNKNQYSHFMEGLDNDWINDEERNQVRYLQMPPGNYIFHAKAKGPDGVAALNEIEIPVLVKQYWYLRWWAIVLYFILFATVVSMIYKSFLRRKYDRLETIRVKEFDKVKTNMYTNITHEFRTPLTVMLGMNDAVIDYTNNGEIDKIYQANEMIDRNGRNLLNLINQMLELSKLESGLLKVNNQQGNIIDYLKYRLESFQSYAEAKNIHIHFLPEETKIIMDYDADKVSYIIGNLIANAIKFTPKDGNIYFNVNRFLNDSNTPYLRLKVRDTGIGIKPDKIDLIFDRFYQVDDSNNLKGEGTGIGLSLVKELVKLFNGTITVKSTINKGSEFTVLLPITNNTALNEVSLSGSSNEWSGSLNNLVFNDDDYLKQDQNIPLVLIVEDNADVSHYIAVSIKDNFRIARAKDGNEGVEKAVELIPDIIISDVMMPEKDGFELCETIKKDERTSHIPVILLTGKADVNSKIEGLQHGADVYLAKPFNKTELLVRLKNLMTLRSEIQKHYSENDLNQSINNLPKIENSFLSKIRAIILDYIDDDEFGIVDLCEQIHVSRAQLHRKLIALTGESTSHLIRKIRLEKAKELLSSSNLNVSEVAYMVGFKTQAHFSRAFSETFGISPSDFRKK